MTPNGAPPLARNAPDSPKADSKRSVAAPTSDDYSLWTVDQLKLECTARKLSVAKNTNKRDRAAILAAYDESKGGVQLLVESQRLERHNRAASKGGSRRSPHCVFRLMNVLFSNAFFARLLSSGDQLTCAQLDDGGSHFWEEVAEAYNTTKTNRKRKKSDDILSALADSIARLVDTETSSKQSNLVEEKVALARLKRNKLEQEAEKDKLFTLEAIVQSHRHTVAQLDVQIQECRLRGVENRDAVDEQRRLREKVRVIQAKLDHLETEIINC